MSLNEAIGQRDLRNRSREIMDAVESGSSFTVTRDGREVGEFIPIQRKRTFVTREAFASMSSGIGFIDPVRFRKDTDSQINGDLVDPYER